ncbi:Serine/threonine exchanger SteT [Mycoplasmopsis maculosa]|uniref:Serine/threonine exchanger SteT n=1 Tax=Mycoplasmopsis maculosa TaxID=114885 RepID=A0A449B3Y4_9BACT|nr:APC family permease [Mycoplasmopsis maculosa]VEU75313.1 Serine/threonine exchanger SteT [Mycoplasmopsis maculosa]
MPNIKTKEKKISFISAMLIVIGGSIGAGIFFKSGSVLSSSHSSIILAAFCWIIASVAVITMGLSLIEISSVRNDNLSLMSWTKVFNNRKIYLSSKNFMTYICFPLTYFFMPLYAILTLQDSFTAFFGKPIIFGTSHDWLIWLIISLFISIYFLTIPTIWSRIGDIQNKVFLSFKFIPLVFIAIIGFILAGTNTGGVSEVKILVESNGSISHAIKVGDGIASFSGIGAGLGVFLAIAAIFFAYDGFYAAAGVQSEMKEPKKTPAVIFLGLAFTTLIYLLIAISMSINGGSFSKMQDYIGNLFGNLKVAKIIFGLMNLFITIGVFGIINSYSMWVPRYIEDLLALGDLPFWEKLNKKLNPNRPIVGVIYSLIITITIVTIFTIIGSLAYLPLNKDYLVFDSKNDWRALLSKSGGSMSRLYSFADLMSNWTSSFTFAYIGVAILGGIINRKTNRIKIIDKKKYFLPAAYISVIIVFISLLVTIVIPIIDLFLLIGFDSLYTARNLTFQNMNVFLNNQYGYKNSWTILETMNLNASLEASIAFSNINVNSLFNDLLISRISIVIVLIIYILLSFLPTYIEDKINKKKFGSLNKYYEYKNKILGIKG